MRKRFWVSKKKLKRDLQGYLYLIRSDARDHTSEINKILSIAEKFGLKSTDLNQQQNILGSPIIKFSISHNERLDHLYFIIALLLHDEPYYVEEVDFCFEMALLLGFDRTSAPTIVREIYNGIKNNTKKEEIKRKLKNTGNDPSPK